MRLTPNQQKILRAIDRGARTCREICELGGVSSTSVVQYNLRLMAAEGLVALDSQPRGAIVEDWRATASAWDAAARLAGNEEA